MSKGVGYIAPEYLLFDFVNEKTDVYSFGMVLLFLLTGSTPYESDVKFRYCPPGLRCRNCNDDEDVCEYDLTGRAVRVARCSVFEESRFEEITDPIIVGDGLSPVKVEQLRSFVNLAFKCCSKSAVERPTMIDVAKELKKLYVSCTSTSS